MSAYLLVICLGAQSGAADAKGIEYFEKNVRPVLVTNCYRCHADEGSETRGGLALDTRDGLLAGGESGPAIVPGKPDESLLLTAIRQTTRLKMPPKATLEDAQIEAIEHWIRIGAPDPRVAAPVVSTRREIDLEAGREFWAFTLPVKASPPATRDGTWPRGDLDRFVLAGLEAAGLGPAPEADRATLLRRLTYDLTGLPPTPGELESFRGDTSPKALERVVDRLLASERFGERWGRHWLDIARYGESTGRTRNYVYPHAWRFRDYVIESFNRDKPIDVFLREQIAGDLLPAVDGESAEARHERLIATGFLALGSKDLNERDRRQFQMDNVDEQIDVLGRGVLALTIGCARCHDHKFDPLPTEDYYALAGVFASTEILAGYGSRRGGGNALSTKLLIPLDDGTNEKTSSDSAPGGGDASGEPDRRPRRQIAREMRAIQQRLAEAEAAFRKLKGAERVAARRRAQGARRRLAVLREQIGGPRGDVRGKVASGSFAMGVRDAPAPADTRVLLKGEVSKPGARVTRGVPEVLAAPGTQRFASLGETSGRLELARWISSAENPLTARVFVNRVWQHLFGEGLVRTVDNFGSMGERPSHPELLDWLAIRLIDGGWSLKRLVRDIVLSRSYTQSFRNDELAVEKDPDNRLLWRARQRRIEVEALRDSMLAASGAIDLERPQGSLLQGASGGEIGRKRKRGSGQSPVDVSSTKRSVYLPVVRGLVPDAMSVFDFADPSMVVGRRDVTTVATQALYLMNSPFVLEQARLTAKRLLESAFDDDASRVHGAYRLTLARDALDTEVDRALEFIQAVDGKDRPASARGPVAIEAWTQLCHALFASAEFRYLR